MSLLIFWSLVRPRPALSGGSGTGDREVTRKPMSLLIFWSLVRPPRHREAKCPRFGSDEAPIATPPDLPVTFVAIAVNKAFTYTYGLITAPSRRPTQPARRSSAEFGLVVIKSADDYRLPS